MNDKCVLITGAAGCLGRALIEKFYYEGWKIFAADCETLNSSKAEFVKFDPSSAKSDAPKAIETISKNGYTLDAVVCAHREVGPLVQSTELQLSDWEALLRKNVFSYYMISRCAAKAIISSKKKGNIVFIGDICYKGAVPDRCAYTSSMGAIHSMTKGLALDFAPYGISVNCVLPGPIAYDNENNVKFKYVPLGTKTTPNQIATTAYFLSCASLCNITGTSIVADGGMDCLVPGAF